jgi:hypothetical protein
MNGNEPPPRLIPPPSPSCRGAEPPLGTDPAEQTPIAGLLAAAEAVLRQPRRVMFQLRQPHCGSLNWALLLIALACSLVYGLVVGSFSGGEQYWAAPVKIALGLLLSGLICLPSLYIFACLSGAQVRLAEMVGLVGGLLALTAVLLVGFAPVAWVFSQSTESVAAMGGLHLAFGLIAASFGVRFLNRAFEHLNAKTLSGLRIWTLIFLLVALQMTTALRPIVGRADTFLPTTKKFFVSHWTDSLREGATASRPSGENRRN